jgi:protein-S-isoprenylcysteine O-methyltransferase Ste14
MLEGILFVAATAGIIYVSRSSLRVPRSHGFYRFFAWEFLLLLFLVNLRRWFHEPFSLHQIVSWVLLLTSLFLVLEGLHLLRRYGKPNNKRDDESLIEFEKTSTLVTTGLYRYIRHPLYSSLLFLAWGTFFKVPSWLGGLLAVASTIFLLLTARVEEGENIRFFGTAYQDYMKQSKMFIPYPL